MSQFVFGPAKAQIPEFEEGQPGLVPAAGLEDQNKFLKGNGTWETIPTELPAVTSSDNGKFLTVVNGVWTATTMQAWQGGNY